MVNNEIENLIQSRASFACALAFVILISRNEFILGLYRCLKFKKNPIRESAI